MAPRIPTHASKCTVMVKPPEKLLVMLAADKLAEYVTTDGWAFEQLILEKVPTPRPPKCTGGCCCCEGGCKSRF